MGEFSIGQSVRRREDPRLLMGRGRYFDDLKLADQLHAAIVRSPHAHADIRGIETRDDFRVEIFKGGAKPLTAVQNGAPGEAGLEAFEHQHFP